MKYLSALLLTLAMAFPSLAATTYPASTNANQTFFGINTFSQPTYSTSPTTNSPANNEFATAKFVRGLFNDIGIYYNSTNIDNTATNPGVGYPMWTYQSTIPLPASRFYTTSDYLTNGGYIGGVMTTNTFPYLNGPIQVCTFMCYSGGSGQPTLWIHPELFYSYDKTNWIGYFESGSAQIIHGVTNEYVWSVTFPPLTATNAAGFYLQRRYKVDSVTGNGVRTITSYIGTNAISGPMDASHAHIQGPASTFGNAYLPANQVWTGSNLFTQPIVGLATSNLSLAGGTVTGPVLSTSLTTNSPSASELASAGWVRGLFGNIGAPYYNTTNLATFGTNVGSGQPLYLFAIDVIPQSSSRTYTTSDFLTNNGYVGSLVTTNTFLQIGGPVEVNAYLAYTGGTGTPTLSVHPEIYYSYDRTNWLGDWSAANQNIVNGATNLYQFVVSVPTVNSTNSAGFYIQRRFKVGSVTGNGVRTFNILIGTNAISGPNIAGHIDLPAPTIAGGNAYLQANQTFTGINTFSQPINAFTSMTNILNRTNSQLQTVDFKNAAFSEGDFATNATFAWLGFVGLVSTQYQSTTIWLTNSSGSLITFTAPANCHASGTLNCTNLTECVFKYNAGRWTNLLALPLW